MSADVSNPIATGKSDRILDAPRRALSLDALRGLAILGMVLSGMVPYFKDTLPPWMYHAQLPPPGHVYDAALTGLTWVDVVFPLFLFALGAAIPLAMGPRLDRGESRGKISTGLLWRGLLLLFFALYEQHLEPGLLKDTYGQTAWLLGPLAFAILFPIYLRLPRRWPVAIRLLVRALGWGAAITLLSQMHYQDGSGFTVHRHDIIIVILANVAVGTGVVWISLRGKMIGRLGIMALVILMLASRQFARWGMDVTELTALRSLLGDRIFEGIIWACHPMYQQYLLITIPGTFAGEILAGWLRPGTSRLSHNIQNSRWGELGTGRCVALMVVCVGIVACTITGLYQHRLVETAILDATLIAIGFLILYSPPGRSRISNTTAFRNTPKVSALMFRPLFIWAAVCVAIGLAVQLYDGGIRKDPASLSYMFVSTGLGFAILIALAMLTDALHRPRWVGLLIANGQNAMMAYVAGGMVIMPMLHLIPAPGGDLLGWLSQISQGPWAGFARGLGYTLLTAMFVWLLTRLRLIWRA